VVRFCLTDCGRASRIAEVFSAMRFEQPKAARA